MSELRIMGRAPNLLDRPRMLQARPKSVRIGGPYQPRLPLFNLAAYAVAWSIEIGWPRIAWQMMVVNGAAKLKETA